MSSPVKIRKGYVDTPAWRVRFPHREGRGGLIVCLHQTASSAAM